MPVQAWVWWQQLGLVMAGGALGAAARFWLGGVLMRHLGSGFPWGTFAVNVTGCFAIGLLAQLSDAVDKQIVLNLWGYFTIGFYKKRLIFLHI